MWPLTPCHQGSLSFVLVASSSVADPALSQRDCPYFPHASLRYVFLVLVLNQSIQIVGGKFQETLLCGPLFPSGGLKEGPVSNQQDLHLIPLLLPLSQFYSTPTLQSSE